MAAYDDARQVYEELGVDVDAAIQEALLVPVSIHCWQADDVGGFEVREGGTDSGGIMATGNFPGGARNAEELRKDYEKVLSLVPGIHRANLHAIYAETDGRRVERDQLSVE